MFPSTTQRARVTHSIDLSVAALAKCLMSKGTVERLSMRQRAHHDRLEKRLVCGRLLAVQQAGTSKDPRSGAYGQYVFCTGRLLFEELEERWINRVRGSADACRENRTN